MPNRTEHQLSAWLPSELYLDIFMAPLGSLKVVSCLVFHGVACDKLKKVDWSLAI